MCLSLAAPAPTKNRLLAALLSANYARLVPLLEPVALTLGQVLYEASTEISYVYFPEDAVVSLLVKMVNGATTEVGLIGREGMIGLPVFLGGVMTHDRALVRIDGSAMRVKASVLQAELRLDSPLRLLLLRYAQTYLALVHQSAGCSRHHSVEQRLARWLMMMRDHVEADELRFTHQLIAEMIGSRRAGVTMAALTLQAAGLIRYARGRITILDHHGLVESACECYEAVKEQFERLYQSRVLEGSTTSPTAPDPYCDRLANGSRNTMIRREELEMTRDELAKSIAREIEQHGCAEIPTSDIWKVFALNQQRTFPFENAVQGFAERHGWRCHPSATPQAGRTIFYPQEQDRQT